MKKLFFIISLVGLFSLTSCGSEENCRGRADNYKVQKQTSMMAAVDREQEIK